MLRERGIDLIAADSPTAFLDDGPTSKLIRQVLGAVAEFDKAMTVAKLKGARDRKRRDTGKCEGRKSFAEMAAADLKRGNSGLANAIAMAKRLHRSSPKTGERRSLRKIAKALKDAGHINAHGREFNPASIKAMVEGKAVELPPLPAD
jgi:DNA invertase Pin-like site-specific DNA recombinase